MNEENAKKPRAEKETHKRSTGGKMGEEEEEGEEVSLVCNSYQCLYKTPTVISTY